MKIFFNTEEKKVIVSLFRHMADIDPTNVKILKSIEKKVLSHDAKFKIKEVKFIRLVAHHSLIAIEGMEESEKREQAFLCNYLLAIVDRVNAKFGEGIKLDDEIKLRKEAKEIGDV